MSRKALGEAILSLPFRNELERILDARGRRNSTGARTVSRETYAHRHQVLLHAFAELQRLGYRLPAPRSLRDSHVRALVQHWVEQGKQAATIQNHLSVLRLFAEWIGKRGMVRETHAYVEDPAQVRRATVARQNKAWSAKGVEVGQVIARAHERHSTLGLLLELIAAFGLRLKEAVCLMPKRDMLGAFLSARDGTKGGRQRMIPIETEAQRELLVRALNHADQKTGRLTPRQLTARQAYHWARYRLRKLGLTRRGLGVTAHGLRHEYAQQSYRRLTGVATPIEGASAQQIDPDAHAMAGFDVAERLGHSRTDVTRAYYGSHGHALRVTEDQRGVHYVAFEGKLCKLVVVKELPLVEKEDSETDGSEP